MVDVISLQWENGTENYFWESDPECGKYRTRFVVSHSLPTRALISYPGSGNTWIRYLLEAATGVFTGSVFNDKSIFKAGHYGETADFMDGTTILQKTHHRAVYTKFYHKLDLSWRKNQIHIFGGRAVLVIRNPYEAILSYWNFKQTQSHTKTVAVRSLHSAEFRKFARVGALRWLEIIQDWLLYSTDLYVVLYEVRLVPSRVCQFSFGMTSANS